MGANITITTSMLNDKRVGRIADLKTIGNDDTIQEAIDYGYVVGKKSLIGQNVKGVLKAMSDGVARDGNGRKINEVVSLQAYATGKLDDITDDIDKSKIGVRLVARALKDMQVDTSAWAFTVEGSTANTISISSITTGEKMGEIVVKEAVDINGFGLALGEGDTVAWSIPTLEKSGTVDSSLVTTNTDSRLTIDGSLFESFTTSEYDGVTVVFTVTVGGTKAIKSATLKLA